MWDDVEHYALRFVRHIRHDLWEWLSDHGVKILIIVIVAWLVKHFGVILLRRVLQGTIRLDLFPTKEDRQRRIETINSISRAILKIGVYIVAASMIISESGINTAPLVASAGIIGLALGLGAQSLIKDFSSGLFIIIDNQYRVGDFAKLFYSSNASVSGTVEAISIRTTALRGLDGTLYHIPNGNIVTTANMTMGVGGMYEEIIIGHDSDISKVSRLINHVGKTMKEDDDFGPKIIDPPRFVRVDGFDLNGLKVKVFSSTTADDSWEVKGEFYRRLLIAFRRNGIELATTNIAFRGAPKVSKPARTQKQIR